jgi:uncharacterized protein YndB with AHSA1/START domain
MISNRPARGLAGCLCARLAALATLAAPAAGAAEHSWRDFKDVSNSSFVEPGGDRAIQLSIEVAASPHDVFDAFTTSEGFSSWAVPVAKVELRIGGFIEASYDSHAKIGDPGNIRNEIVAYVPDRLLVIRNAQAPPGFADPELFRRTVTVIEMVPVVGGRTRVTLTNAGYGTGERFATLYKHFEWGDAYTLAELKRRFDQGPVDWAAVAANSKAQAAATTVEGSH